MPRARIGSSTKIALYGKNRIFWPKTEILGQKKGGHFFPLDYLGKGNFFLWTTFSGRGQNMVRGKKWPPFFWPKISVFGQKIRFLPYDPNFRWWPVFSPRPARGLDNVLTSMKEEVSSRRFSSRQLIIAHQDETFMQTVWNYYFGKENNCIQNG